MSGDMHKDWDKADPANRHKGGKIIYSSPALMMEGENLHKEYLEGRHQDDGTWTLRRIVIFFDHGKWVPQENEIMAQGISFEDVMSLIESYEIQKESESSGSEGGVQNTMKEFWTMLGTEYRAHTPRHRRREQRREREREFNPKWKPY